jgi:hypothetical protein
MAPALVLTLSIEKPPFWLASERFAQGGILPRTAKGNARAVSKQDFLKHLCAAVTRKLRLGRI